MINRDPAPPGLSVAKKDAWRWEGLPQAPALAMGLPDFTTLLARSTACIEYQAAFSWGAVNP